MDQAWCESRRPVHCEEQQPLFLSKTPHEIDINIERRPTGAACVQSDLTDAEWALVAPLIRPAKRGGRPRTVKVREVLNAIFYVLWTGCQWKALPKDLPPRSTVWEYLDLWDWD